jgi:ribosome maturation protein Sdo1
MDNSIIYFFEFDSRRYTKNRKKQQIILFIAKVALTSRSDFNYGVPKEVVTKATSMKKAEIIPKNLIRVMPA